MKMYIPNTGRKFIFLPFFPQARVWARRPVTEITQTISEWDPFRNCNIRYHLIGFEEQGVKKHQLSCVLLQLPCQK